MRRFVLFFILVSSVHCTKKPATQRTPAEEGAVFYSRHCIACHSPDPKVDGMLGPAVAGSSLELLERRLVHGDYPPGYKPKRDTKQMVPLPFIKDQIPALHAYLNSL